MYISTNKLKSLVARENTLTMRRLMSAIDRVEKEDVIPVEWLMDKADEYTSGGHERLADDIISLIEEYKSE